MCTPDVQVPACYLMYVTGQNSCANCTFVCLTGGEKKVGKYERVHAKQRTRYVSLDVSDYTFVIVCVCV